MARPTKQGIDYFPLDTQFDDKVELFIVENGPVSLSVLVTAWQLIYKNEGYYADYSDDLFLLIKRRLLLDVPEIKIIIDAAVKRGLFSNVMFSKYKILTSSAIQKRFFIASRKKKIVDAVKNYICSGVSDVGNDNVKWIDVAGNATKEKEEEEAKEKEKVNGKFGTFKNVSLSDNEKAKLDERFSDCVDEKINALSEYMKSKGKQYKSHFATILAWDRKDNGKPQAGATSHACGYGGTGKRLL